MEWKDIWTEILLKAGFIKPERGKRKPAFARHEIRELIVTSSVIKNRLLSEIEKRVNKRAITSSYLFTDNRIFEPFVDLMVINLQGREFHSYVFEIGLEIKRFIEAYETKNRVRVNKTDLFFGLALCSIYKNSTINASIYWELSQQEEANTLMGAYNPVVSLQNTIQRFSSAISPIEYGLKENAFYNKLTDNYTWIGDFKTNMLKLHDPETFSYFSSGL